MAAPNRCGSAAGFIPKPAAKLGLVGTAFSRKKGRELRKIVLFKHVKISVTLALLWCIIYIYL